MSVQEMKKKIVERIELIETDSALNEITKLLDSIESTSKSGINLSSQYDKIATQYGEVLKKLAE